MKTLVQGIICPEIDFKKDPYIQAGDFFKKDLVAEIRVEDSPLEVLKAAIPNFKIASYIGAAPWLVLCGENKKYISISKLDSDDHLKTVTISDFLKCPDFQQLRRKQLLSGEQAEELASQLCYNLMPENYFGIGLPRYSDVSRVYSDVLLSLGYNVPCEVISKMISVQNEILDQEQMGDRIRRAQDWNELEGQVVGAES
jgi:hypothetical protein